MSGNASGDTERENEHRSGEWVGQVRGMRVREPGDLDGPVLEIHGEEGMAAMVFNDEAFVEGLTHAAAEVQMVFDECSVEREIERGGSE